MLGFLGHPLPLPQTPDSTPYEGWKNMDTHDLHLYMWNDGKIYQELQKHLKALLVLKPYPSAGPEERLLKETIILELSKRIWVLSYPFANLVDLQKVSFKEIAEEWMLNHGTV